MIPQLTINPSAIAQINPALVQEAARQAALEEASRPRLNLLGFAGIAALGAAAWMLFRKRR